MADKLENVLQEIKAKAWESSIAPRAEGLLSLLRGDFYQNGVVAWMKSQEQELVKQLRIGSKTRDDDQFIRGQLSTLGQIIDLADNIQNYLTAKAENDKRRASIGRTSY
jgi:hypothetical protein